MKKGYILIICTLSFINDLIAQHYTSTDSMLIKYEQQKWDAMRTGDYSLLQDWMSDDFFNIGYMPDGSVYRYQKKKIAVAPVNKKDMKELPIADFKLSDFKVVTATKDVKIVTYIARGPLNLYITTTWAKRQKNWKSIFYQATAFKE